MARKDIVESIAQRFKVVVSRRASLTIGLWGEPGIGKTHTAHAILERIPCKHVSLHAAAPLSSLVRALLTPRHVPAWAEHHLERIKNDETIDPETEAVTLTAFLTGLAPFVVHLEDLHEASEERANLVERFAHAILKTRGVGLIVTSRNKPSNAFRTHRLEVLDVEETQALLERDRGIALPSEGLSWMHSRTRGNPLFLREYLQYLSRQGFLWSDGQRWHWREPPRDFVPVTIETLIEQASRHAADTPEFEATLIARALLGSHQDRALWMAVSGCLPEAFEAAVRALNSRGALFEDDFPHPLYREVLLQHLSADRHRAMARRVLGVPDADPEVIVQFVDAAELEPDQARIHFERAARRAEAGKRTVQAGRFLARAADHAVGTERGERAHRAARLLMNADVNETERLLRVVLAENPDDTDAIIELAGLYAMTGKTAEMNRTLERLPEDVTAQASWVNALIQIRISQRDYREVLRIWNEHPELRVDPHPKVARSVALAMMELNDPEGAEALVTAALERSEVSAGERSALLVVRALAKRLVGDFVAARSAIEEAVRLAREQGEPISLALALYNRIQVLRMMGLHIDTLSDAKEGMRLYREAGFTLMYASSLTTLGIALGDMGHYQEAELKMLESYDLLSSFGDSTELASNTMNLCWLYLTWRPPHYLMLAEKYAQRGLLVSKALQPYDMATALYIASRAAIVAGRAAVGLRLAEEALGVPDVISDVRARAFVCKALALDALGRREEAIACLETTRTISHGLRLRVVEFELAFLKGNLEDVRSRLAWFREHHWVGIVDNMLRRCPELAEAPGEPLPERAQGSLGLRLGMLGPLRLERDGKPIALRGRKRQELLAYLCEARIAGRSEVTTLDLLETLFPLEDETAARNALKQQIFQARSSLGADCIVSTPNGYALGNVSSDAEAFLETGEADAWRGAYLEGIGEGWIPNVHDAISLALRSRIEVLIGTEITQAVRLARILLEMEPYDPPALRLALRALMRAGDERGAARLFADHRAQLLEVEEVIPTSLEAFLSGPVSAAD